MGIIVLQAIFVMEKWHKSHHNELIVFHQTARSHIGIQRGDSLYLLSSHDSITNITPYFIKDYNIAKGISNMEYKKLNINLLKWNNQSIMLIDSAGIYEGLSIRPDYLLLRDSPKIHLEMMLDSLRPKILIADGSNYKLYVKKWKETCHRKGITFHYTGTDGAFELD
jgi:competence protein ComEC